MTNLTTKFEDIDQITQENLKKFLIYNPDTGIFYRKTSTSRNIKVGFVAGCLTVLGYTRIGVGGKHYLAHRLAWLYMYGAFPPSDIDHINHIRTDNRLSNLRLADKKINSRNNSKSIKNTSGVTGVSWCNTYKKWRSRITTDEKRVSLGSSDDFFEAVCARKSAERNHGYRENHGQ